MANFTDFDPLALELSVSLAFLEQPEEMAAADLLILPGSKQTLDDLEWLEQRGFGGQLRRLHSNGVPIVGICGGFQMLGVAIEDPAGIENDGKPCRRTGLALLPVRTILRAEKTVRRVQGRLRDSLFGGASRTDGASSPSMNGHLRRCRCTSGPHVRTSTLRSGCSRRLASDTFLNRLQLPNNQTSSKRWSEA